LTGINGKKATRLCPCGYLGDSGGRCHCTAEQVQRYRARLSGPFLDRIDLHVEVPKVPHQELRNTNNTGPTSAEVRQRVQAARQRQLRRAGKLNRALNTRDIEHYCPHDNGAAVLLEQAMERLGLSARAYHRILKVARTIADLAEASDIDVTHVTEAISYRRLDRRAVASGAV